MRGVVLAGALMAWKGWGWIDPVVSLLIAPVIMLGTWSLFRQSVHLLFDGMPEGMPAACQAMRIISPP